MEIIEVGLCLNDGEYAVKLAEGMAREFRGLKFHLLDDLNDIDNLDIVIASRSNGNPKIVEARLDMADNIGEHEPFQICIYKDCPNLINDLLYIYFKLTGKVCRYKGDKKCRLTTVCSTYGNLKVTGLSVELGKHLGRVYDRKSLYINLNPIDESSEYITHEEDGLLKLLYYLDNSIDFPVNKFITEGIELDCLNTKIINSYSYEMSEELFHRLVTKIEELGKYCFIIADVGNHFSRHIRDIISSSDYTVVMGSRKNSLIDETVCNDIKKLKNNKGFAYLFDYEDEAYGYRIADISKKIVEDCELV